MPVNFSLKRIRDKKLIARWREYPDAHFDKLGISREKIEEAQLALQGFIVLPWDSDYNQIRLLNNPTFDPYPSIIFICHVEPDVKIALALTRLLALAQPPSEPFTVRSGGHCTAGFSAGSGPLIDVKKLASITVDAANQTVTVGCGVQFGDLYKTLEAQGLHLPGGECPDVCIGGFVQGGGYGFTSVTFGMNCDNVISMRVMLADGWCVTASRDMNYDLFWAMRGGTGGNFGVLLSVTYKLYPLGDVFGWALAWPLTTGNDIDQATDVLMLLQRDYMRTSQYAPQMNIQVSLCYQNQLHPENPASGPLLPYLLVRGLYVGASDAGTAAIQPLQQMPGCITSWTLTSSFTDLNDKLLNSPQGMPPIFETVTPYEDKQGRYVDRDLTVSEWASILNYFLSSKDTSNYAYLEFYGGLINSYPIEDSAFIHRNVAFSIVLDVFWMDPDGRAGAENFLQGWLTLLQPMCNGHVYQNYPSINLFDYANSYWGEARFGLYAVKQKYDPKNVFKFRQAVSVPSFGGPGPVITLPPALQAALDQPIIADAKC